MQVLQRFKLIAKDDAVACLIVVKKFCLAKGIFNQKMPDKRNDRCDTTSGREKQNYRICRHIIWQSKVPFRRHDIQCISGFEKLIDISRKSSIMHMLDSDHQVWIA